MVDYLQDILVLVVQLWGGSHIEGWKPKNPAILAFYEEFCYNRSRFKKCPFWTTIDQSILTLVRFKYIVPTSKEVDFLYLRKERIDLDDSIKNKRILRERSNEVRNLKKKIKTRDDRIEELEYDLNDANETIDELENKASSLQEALNLF